MTPFDGSTFTEVQTRPEPVLDEDGKVLVRAIDEIRQRGWWANKRDRQPYGVCMMLAVWYAAGCSKSRADATLPRLGFATADDAFRWNDAQPNEEPVIARLRSAAHAVPR